jgi:hypothetical protein
MRDDSKTVALSYGDISCNRRARDQRLSYTVLDVGACTAASLNFLK